MRQARQAAVALEQHHELIPGKPGDSVGPGQAVHQPTGDFLQQLVGRLVAQAFVEHLEAIQINEEHGQVPVGASGTLTGVVQPLLEQAAVGQAGELVVAAQVAQALLDLTPQGEIGNEGDHIADRAIGVTHRAQLHPLRVIFAVLARLDEFALPAAVTAQRFAHAGVQLLALRRAGQPRDTVADQFLAAVAGQLAAGVVDRQQPITGVHDRHAFAGRLEHHGGQALLLGLAVRFADIAAGADHAQGTAILVTQDHAATVLDPERAAVVPLDAIFDLVGFSLAFQVRHHGVAHTRHVVSVQTVPMVIGLPGRQPGLIDGDAQAGVMHLIVAQIPVPQPQLAGLQRKAQTRLALAQCLDHAGQLPGALRDPLLETVMGFAQLPLGQPALVDLAGQFGIQFPRLAADVLQALDQQGVVRSLLQAQGNQAVDLPGDHAEGEQHDQPQQPPALLNRQLTDEQQQTGGQQARQGKTQECPQRYPAGNAAGDDDRAQHAVEQGLRQKAFRGHQGDNRIAEDQCR